MGQEIQIVLIAIRRQWGSRSKVQRPDALTSDRHLTAHTGKAARMIHTRIQAGLGFSRPQKLLTEQA
jgi:hypothetical protein